MARPRSLVAFLAIALVAALDAPSAQAQQFTGTFTVPNEVGGVMTVALRQAGTTVTGTLSSNGVTYKLQGRIEDGTAIGSMQSIEGALFFEADRWENELWLVLYGTDAQGQPNYDDYTEIDLIEEGTAAASGSGAVDGFGASAGGFGTGRASAGNPLAGGAGNPLAGDAVDPYVGVFSDGQVTLQLQGTGGQYQGQVSVAGAVYPVQAEAGTNGIEGVIVAPDGQYALLAQAQGNGLIVVSGGMQYSLARQNVATGQADGFGRPAAGQPMPQRVPQPGVRPGGAAAPQAGAERTRTGRELAPGFTEDHPQVREWLSFLSGKKLTRMSSYSSGSAGGYSARTDVYLCSNMSFAMRDESSVSVDVGGAFGSSGGLDGGQGTWYVITNGQVVGLILEFANGQTQEFRMDYQNQETYANGERVYVTPAEVCM